MSSPYFLFSVAINQYRSKDIPNLHGCLNDAESLKSCLSFILGQAPPRAIYSLTDARATRSAIISGFFEHLIDNPEINPGDPIIIHYSGHGGRTVVPGGWSIPARTAETLCPSDEWMLDSLGKVIPGIPDVTVNALLRLLARRKGNNITFICDSCHSGGIDRSIDASHPAARYNAKTPPLPSDIDHHILHQANCVGEAFPFHGDYESHILLAACAEDQRAHEVWRGLKRVGAFTEALTTKLRQLKNMSSIEHVTYSQLVTSLSLSHSQNPQCEGHHGECFLFGDRNGRTPFVFPLTVDNRTLHVAAGEAHGVTVGTEMSIYRHASALKRLGVMVVDQVGPVSATLRRRLGDDDFEVPRNSWAGISTWNAGDIRVFAASLRLPDSSHSEYRLLRADVKEESHIALHATSSGYITVERQDPLMTKFSSPSVDSMLTVGPSLPRALQKIAHFYFHLGRRQAHAEALLDSNSLSTKHVSLHMRRLENDEGLLHPGSKITLAENTFYLDAEHSGCYYTLTIDNKSHYGLYPYLFYFNPDDYSITAVYLPPTTAVWPPLKAYASLTIGDGRCGTRLNFTLRGGCFDGGFFKLIVCTRNISLAHIAQKSPLFETPSAPVIAYPDGDSCGERMMLDVLHTTPEFWSASVVAVTFRKREPWSFSFTAFRDAIGSRF
ncbi:ICE-like protease (Caspase) p20 domain protein [Mycena venus]|uniref:ICE-like protease (Caspase) p20 domain protein n=1 Tax=Mycena venus TaxID=2733690 RepID=A0A8H6X5K1_9AGAR|nr:ICE-like protease (Caspase) p20 domain protein [Mycena venus]